MFVENAPPDTLNKPGDGNPVPGVVPGWAADDLADDGHE